MENVNVERQGRKILLNISGQQFITTLETLSKYPDTRLGRLVNDNSSSHHFYEGDPDIFKEILKFYWCDRLHCPKSVCFEDFKDHLEYWEIDIANLSRCCAGEYKEEASLQRQFDFFDRQFESTTNDSNSCCSDFRYNMWCMLTEPGGRHTKWKLASKLWSLLYLSVTLTGAVSQSVMTWVVTYFVYRYVDEGNSPDKTIPTNTTTPANTSTPDRSEEHTSELQSHVRISYAVFCLQKK